MKRNILCFCVLAFLVAFATGCSDKCKVTGKVTYADGSPLTVGMINFTNDTIQARGSVDKDGNYKISSEGRNDGIKRGTYKVYITQASGFDTSEMEAVEQTEGRTAAAVGVAPLIKFVDDKFERPETSGLTVDVKGKTEFNITVYKPGEAPAAEAAE